MFEKISKMKNKKGFTLVELIEPGYSFETCGG